MLFVTVDLLGLLKWRSDQDNIKRSLESLMKVDGEEVVKVSSGARGHIGSVV